MSDDHATGSGPADSTPPLAQVARGDLLRVLDDLRLWLTEAIEVDQRRSQSAQDKGRAWSAVALAGGVGGCVAARRKLNELDPRIGAPVDFGGSLTPELPSGPTPLTTPPILDFIDPVARAVAHLDIDDPDGARRELSGFSTARLRQLGQHLDRLSMICFELVSAEHYTADDAVTLPPEIAERIRAATLPPPVCAERLQVAASEIGRQVHLAADKIRAAFDSNRFRPGDLYFTDFSRYNPPSMTITDSTTASAPPLIDLDESEIFELGELEDDSEDGPR